MRKITQLLFNPFKIISENRGEFYIWFLFTIITGQFGIIANVLVRKFTNGTPISYSILMDSINGSFYTFSIALVASLLGPIFIDFINSKKLYFKTLKTFTIIVSIFFLFITGIIYAAIQSTTSNATVIKNLSIDYTQIIIYILAILIVSYGYCILRLDRKKADFGHLDDPMFNEVDDKNVEHVIAEKEKVVTDSKGVEL
ncbi:hypothetical protein HPE56_15975 [Maribacter sp. ANRC-HE7]|uniref:DUF805 domain-containing protein n=1 Tax=Maribacter aquimaris TaxID=2737171 RepID=A0ABR7V5R7_9FLAO|nr:hypothetical protein [Maribacter aquimaris]MBD0779299.1 hypothetical protein [Maribacter aquimaris]